MPPVIFNKIKSYIRFRLILKKHFKVANFWHSYITKYFNGKLEKFTFIPKVDLKDKKIIWQYWGQGIDDNLPEVIKICFKSVDKHKGDYEVIRLTDKTINDYIDFPQFILDKLEDKTISKTHFSDILRLALLKAYGGVWLDATILLTDKLPKEYEKMDYSMYQRSDNEQHKKYWENVYAYYYSWNTKFKVRVLNSIIFAKKDNYVISVLLDLLLNFWKENSKIPDYFFFQILYNELMSYKLKPYNCRIENDCIPHFFQTKLNGDFPYMTYKEIIATTSIHKMAYFTEEKTKELENILTQINE